MESLVVAGDALSARQPELVVEVQLRRSHRKRFQPQAQSQNVQVYSQSFSDFIFLYLILIKFIQDLNPKKPRTAKPQDFVEHWLQHEHFKDWLQKKFSALHEYYRAWCICCESWHTNGKSELEAHMKTKLHVNNLAKLPGILELQRTMADHMSSSLTTVEDVAKYEMVQLCLVAQQNFPISAIEQMIAINRRLHPKDPVLAKVQLGRTKTIAIIQDGKISLNEIIYIYGRS